MWLHVPDEPPEVGDDDLKVLSLCSGAAMLDVALAEGWRELTGRRAVTVGYCERQAGPAATLVARMADSGLDRAPVWDDLESFPCEAYRGRVDCVSAGIPCQPWSAAGAKLGLRDPRWLWPQVLRILRGTGAGMLWLENVRGFLAPGSAGETGWVYPSGLDLVLRDLADMGWVAEWGCLPASAVGARHQRYRVFVLAIGDDTDLARQRGKARQLRPGRNGAPRAGSDRPKPERTKRGTHSQRRGRPLEGNDSAREETSRSEDGSALRADAEGIDRRLHVQHGRPDEAGRNALGQGSAGTDSGRGVGGQGTDALRARQPEPDELRQDRAVPNGARHAKRQGVGRHDEPQRPATERGRNARSPRVPSVRDDLPFFALPPQKCEAWQGHALIEPEVEPGLRRRLHGVALVLDEARNLQLRTSGNGVVALQAAVAAVVLGRRLGLNGKDLAT